ncbi:MAG: NAD-dependent epimerase/dehydratase family protein [Sulfuricaulis sp.]|nr:NAD-dependent epimerase/dehydratase family protein [Sulfuricaulis sp.]
MLVTGGSGFIGRYLVDALIQRGADVTILSRHPSPAGMKGKTVVGDLTRPETLDDVCRGFTTVFHLAGDAHAIDRVDDNERLGWRTTVEGTSALVDQSIRAGVSRFVYFSSVKAMGEGGKVCLDETAVSSPVTSYGKAKREAEKIVLDACQRGLASTVLRLPMVYGPGCKGNLPRMIQAIARGLFPPLPEIGNKRSMVDVRDVVEAALLAADNPAATGKIYVVTDGQAYSTRQMYERICTEVGRPVPRWTIPISLLRFAAYVGDMIDRLRGRRFFFDTEALDKLTNSAWYSSDKISRELNFRPAHTLMSSIHEIVAEVRKSG